MQNSPLTLVINGGGGQPVNVQVGMNRTVVGSKDAVKKPEPA